MLNKRGQFFSLYLVLLTLLMCGIVIGTYVVQQRGVGNSMVSPKGVLDVRDDLDVFELREVEMIKSSLNFASGTFPQDDFIDSFREIYVLEFINDESMKSFIRNDLVVEEGALDNFRNFLEGGLYIKKLTRREGSNLIFTRASVRKYSLLEADDKTKINFPVDFYFDFEREYLITRVNGEFEVAKR